MKKKAFIFVAKHGWLFRISLAILCLMSVVCSGQDGKKDSLLLFLGSAEEDTLKVKAFNELFLEYEFSDDMKAIEYLDKALELSQKVNYKTGLALTYLHYGFFAEDKGDYPKALKNHLTSLQLYESIGSKKGVANSYNNIGIIYQNQGSYSKALKTHMAALEIRQVIGDRKGIATSYNNIGIVHYFQGNYPETVKNYLAALKIREEIGNKKDIADSYNNLGSVYTALHNYNESLKCNLTSLKMRQAISDKKGEGYSYNNIGVAYEGIGNFPEALKNHIASLKIKQAIGDKYGVASSYNNIGLIYYEEGILEQDPVLRNSKFEEGLKNHKSALSMREEIGDRSGITSSYYNTGLIYTKQKKYKDAEEYFMKAKALAKEIGYKKYLENVYHALTEVDSAKGNFKGAYDNHKLYILYRDSLDNEETRKKTIQSQMTFDFEKKEAVADAEHEKELENQQVLAEEKNRKQKIILMFVVGGLLLVIVFSGFVFRSLRITRKQKNTIEEQKNTVEQQKQEVEQQKHLVEEHQKSIIDSITYARRIQRSQLPTEKYIDRTLKRLAINNRQ